MKELEVAERAVVEAGKIASKNFQGEFKVSLKGIRDLVTEVDIECERRIKKIISAEYAMHSFLGEEEGVQGDSPNVWIIDPIDGTTNFAHGIDQFCHSVALVRNGQPVCGAIYNPVQKKLYSAYVGKGAKFNGRPISVSKTENLMEALLITGFPYNANLFEEKTVRSISSIRPQCRDLRRFGSAALDLCYVAHGLCDGFFEYQLKPWDVAAGILIVREAGGKVTDINGKHADVNSGHFLASNGHLHDLIMKHLEGV